MRGRATRHPVLRSVVGLALLTGAATLLLLSRSPAGHGQPVQPELSSQSELVVPGASFFGASAGESQGEVWAVDSLGGTLLRGSDAGWSDEPAPLDPDGRPLTTFSVPHTALAGRTTDGGAVAVLSDKGLLIRDPGGRFRLAPAPAVSSSSSTAPGSTTSPSSTTLPGSTTSPASTTLPGSTTSPASTTAPGSTADPGSTTAPPSTDTAPLHEGEGLYEGSEILLAPTEDDGHAGAYVVPTAGSDDVQDAVLRFDGSAWTREQICLDATPSGCTTPTAASGFEVSAIDAAGPGHAWLLATTGAPRSRAGIILLHRHPADGSTPATWREASLGTSPFAEASPTALQGGTVAPRVHGQALTATSQGVWIDAAVTVGTSKDQQDATLFYDESSAAVTGTWCDLGGGAVALCGHPLGAPLPSGDGRSFAWADGSAFGRRIVTGLAQGVILRLNGTDFHRVPTLGGTAGTTKGAAFAAADDGWLGGLVTTRVTRTPAPAGLRTWPVPFRNPLTAVAPEPGKAAGAIGSAALAVGDDGEIARYQPGAGWQPESLTTSSGARATPRLRGVAWPDESRAYAVGDGAEMWLWRQATGLWEPDPGKPANLALANFTGIAFEPGNPDRGYAIGKQGVLLRYDREWTQEALPDGLGQANFTSIAFAGDEALVAYIIPVESTTGTITYDGGVIANDGSGSGWHRVQAVTDALPARDPAAGLDGSPAPVRVAGLSDGSAVVAAISGQVIERSGAGGGWRTAADALSGFPTALAAFHDTDGAVRAVVSTNGFGGTSSGLIASDSDIFNNPPGPGQPPLLTDPYDLPGSGLLVRQTATGWRDEQHQFYEDSGAPNGSGDYDRPEQPDAIQALLLDPFGRVGWGVGGLTGDLTATAGVVRYPDDGTTPPGSVDTAIPTDDHLASFAIGGGAQCLGTCAPLEDVGAGPWRWLPAAVGRAAQQGGRVRAFLYTGGGVAPGQSGYGLTTEENGYARRLTENAGDLPVFAAATASDLDPDGGLGAFRGAFDAASAPLGSGPDAAGTSTSLDARPADGHAYYAFDSTGTADSGGAVRVIVVDTASDQLGTEQRCWLAGQLADAGNLSMPAIVVGGAAVDELADGDAVAETLVSGGASGCGSRPDVSPGYGASAYFYDLKNENRSGYVTSGADEIPAWGTGSLGYVIPSPDLDKPGVSGWLLAAVDARPESRGAENRAPVTVRLIPNVGEVAVQADDGTLLRRSQVARFEGLARRPRGGMGCYGAPSCQAAPNQYAPVPYSCIGAACATTVAPEYSFTSSDPTVAGFVAHDPSSATPDRVLIGSNSRPVADDRGGLLCAYNPGTTTITLTTGGLSYSQKVTVLAGSVQQPCGTVPATSRSAQPGDTSDAIDPPFPAEPSPTPTPAGGITPVTPPPVPAPARAVRTPHRVVRVPPTVPVFTAPFLPVTSGLTQVVATLPPPPPTAARPAPPSGTSSAQVNQPAVSPERQREEEPAVDTVASMTRYEADAPLPRYVSQGGALALILLAGLALAGARPRPRRPYAYNYSDDHRQTPRNAR